MVELVSIGIEPPINEDIVIEIVHQTCPICIDELSFRLWTCKQCGGKIHMNCIKEWKKQHINYPYSYTCPLCNYTIENHPCINNKVVIDCLNILLLTITLTLISAIFYTVIILAAILGWLLTNSR